MTKKKKARKIERSIANREAYTRMNFLYQAAYVALARNPENLELSRDPNIKRKVCKFCHSLLVPGVTSQVRVKAHRETHVVIKCLDCGTLKRFNARKNYKLWSEQEQNKDGTDVTMTANENQNT